MIELRQVSPYCYMQKQSDKVMTVFATDIAGYVDDKLKRVYLGFKVDIADLCALRFRPHPYWSTEVFSMSDVVYYDTERDECFVTLMLYTQLEKDTILGTIESTLHLEYKRNVFEVNRSLSICTDVGVFLREVASGITQREFDNYVSSLNTFNSIYGYSWLNTAIMLIRRCLITLDDNGDISSENKWVFETLKGFKRHKVEEKIKELISNGVKF